MSFWLQVGGIVLGALSLFKLVQRYAEFGLSSIFTDVISFYQQFFYPITQIVNLAAAFVFSLVGLHIPRGAIAESW